MRFSESSSMQTTQSAYNPPSVNNTQNRDREELICCDCKLPIKVTQFLRVGNYSFHPDHFCCHECRKSLIGEEKPRFRDGQFYCTDHFAQKFCFRCESCNELIVEGNYIGVSGVYYHYHHFVCEICRQPFPDGKYYEDGGKVYCEEHYNNISLCVMCEEPILPDDVVVNMRDKPCHRRCLKCKLCNIELPENGNIYQRNNMVFCIKHFENYFCKLCCKCGGPIMNKILLINDSHYHPECLTCGLCDDVLDTLCIINGHLRCNKHRHIVPQGKETTCFSCSNAITNQCVLALGASFHPGCFQCDFCNKGMKTSDARFTSQNRLACLECLLISTPYPSAQEILDNLQNSTPNIQKPQTQVASSTTQTIPHNSNQHSNSSFSSYPMSSYLPPTPSAYEGVPSRHNQQHTNDNNNIPYNIRGSGSGDDLNRYQYSQGTSTMQQRQYVNNNNNYASPTSNSPNMYSREMNQHHYNSNNPSYSAQSQSYSKSQAYSQHYTSNNVTSSKKFSDSQQYQPHHYANLSDSATYSNTTQQNIRNGYNQSYMSSHNNPQSNPQSNASSVVSTPSSGPMNSVNQHSSSNLASCSLRSDSSQLNLSHNSMLNHFDESKEIKNSASSSFNHNSVSNDIFSRTSQTSNLGNLSDKPLESEDNNESHKNVFAGCDPADGEFDFKRGQQIGKGSFGRVFCALNNKTGETIAIKQIDLDMITPEQREATFSQIQTEVQLMRELQHPNIVTFYGTQIQYTPKARMNIIMEFVPGNSIACMLKQFGPFSENVIINYTRQLLLALSYCHARGVIHRDIKGKNILIHSTSLLKLADFGSAKIFQDVLLKGAPSSSFGYTPHWIAPEVILGGYNSRMDIWSLGCVIVEMATGDLPWAEHNTSNQFQIMFHIASTEAIPTIPERLSAAGKHFLSLCFQRNPDLRPSADELLQHPWVAVPDTSNSTNNNNIDNNISPTSSNI